LDECARCATPGPHRAFHVAAGGAVCVHCRPPGSVTPAPGVLDLLIACCGGMGNWSAGLPTKSADRPAVWSPPSAMHLERQLRTLPLIERSGTVPQPAIAGQAG